MKEIFNRIWELALPYQDKRHDPGHAEVTLRYAKKLLELEKGDEDIVIPAIMLHDVGYSQLAEKRRLSMFSPDTREEDRRAVVFEHQIESIKLAAKILRKVDYPPEMTDEILEIISQHDTRQGFISKNEGLVRDADKLWRTSLEGQAAAKAREEEHSKKFEEGLNRPNYFYSDTARQMALADARAALGPGGETRPVAAEAVSVTDEYMRQLMAKSRSYSLVILRPTAKRAEPGADSLVWEHVRNNFKLRSQGLLPVICPVSDGSDISGIGIFQASVEDTRKIMEDDPAVKAGIFIFEVHPCRSLPGSTLPA